SGPGSAFGLRERDCRLDCLAERLNLSAPPVMEKQNARLLTDHVMVDRDDVDAAARQRLQNRLKLILGNGEVAIYDGIVVGSSECRPCVDTHGLANFAATRRLCRSATDGDLDHAILCLSFVTDRRLDLRLVDRVLAADRRPLEAVLRLRRL